MKRPFRLLETRPARMTHATVSLLLLPLWALMMCLTGLMGVIYALAGRREGWFFLGLLLYFTAVMLYTTLRSCFPRIRLDERGITVQTFRERFFLPWESIRFFCGFYQYYGRYMTDNGPDYEGHPGLGYLPMLCLSREPYWPKVGHVDLWVAKRRDSAVAFQWRREFDPILRQYLPEALKADYIYFYNLVLEDRAKKQHRSPKKKDRP